VKVLRERLETTDPGHIILQLRRPPKSEASVQKGVMLGNMVKRTWAKNTRCIYIYFVLSVGGMQFRPSSAIPISPPLPLPLNHHHHSLHTTAVCLLLSVCHVTSFLLPHLTLSDALSESHSTDGGEGGSDAVLDVRHDLASERSTYASERSTYASERSMYASERSTYASERSTYDSERSMYVFEKSTSSSVDTPGSSLAKGVRGSEFAASVTYLYWPITLKRSCPKQNKTSNPTSTPNCYPYPKPYMNSNTLTL
jgi:hypothetical protein